MLVKYLRKLPFLKKQLDVPSIAKLAMRANYVPNIELLKYKKALFDFYLEPNVKQYDTFDARAAEKIVEEGRRTAREFAPEIKKKLKELKQK